MGEAPRRLEIQPTNPTALVNPTHHNEPDLPLFEPDDEATYSLEIVAKLSGLSSDTILHYKERGFISTVSPDPGKPTFDDDALRILRCIDHLRSSCGVNETGLGLILEMMAELDHLRNHLRTLQ